MRGVRIDVDVELGGRGHVAALEEASPHHDDLVDPRDDVGCLHHGHGEVGERAQRAHGDPVPGGAEGVDDGVDRVGCSRLDARLRQAGAVDARGTVDVLGRDELVDHGPGASGVDRYVGAAGQLDEGECVAGGVFERDVACNGRDRTHVELG